MDQTIAELELTTEQVAQLITRAGLLVDTNLDLNDAYTQQARSRRLERVFRKLKLCSRQADLLYQQTHKSCQEIEPRCAVCDFKCPQESLWSGLTSWDPDCQQLVTCFGSQYDGYRLSITNHDRQIIYWPHLDLMVRFVICDKCIVFGVTNDFLRAQWCS
jgi:hypothetical protein